MEEKSQTQYGRSPDRFIKSAMSDLRKEMTLKIEKLKKEQKELMESLNSRFDCDEFRRLNIINQHLQVAESRRKGDWVRGDFPQYATIKY